MTSLPLESAFHISLFVSVALIVAGFFILRYVILRRRVWVEALFFGTLLLSVSFITLVHLSYVPVQVVETMGEGGVKTYKVEYGENPYAWLLYIPLAMSVVILVISAFLMLTMWTGGSTVALIED